MELRRQKEDEACTGTAGIDPFMCLCGPGLDGCSAPGRESSLMSPRALQGELRGAGKYRYKELAIKLKRYKAAKAAKKAAQ